MPRLDLWRSRAKKFWTMARRTVPFAAGVAAALVAILFYNLLFPAPRPLSAQDVNNTVNQVLASATPPAAFSERVYQIIQPSLILIQTETTGPDGQTDQGLGSGVIVDQAGDILTSLHVVAGANKVQVTFADGTQSSAQVTVQQPQNDIAVLRADNPPAQIVPAVLGNPNAMRIGDEVYAVGNPFGLYGSMSAGVISAFDRSFQPSGSNIELKGLIQIDAAVNPGNSGGPLLNRDGQVIAIVTGLVNPTDQDVFIGIGFAMPITTAGGAAGLPPD